MCLEEELYLSELYFCAIFADLIIEFALSAVCYLFHIVINTLGREMTIRLTSHSCRLKRLFEALSVFDAIYPLNTGLYWCPVI